jgi:hypothetical protein
MESELDLLLGTAIDSLLKLDILLYLHQRPGSVRSSAEIGVAVRQPEAQVAAALDALARTDLVDRFPIGRGRNVIYGCPEDPHIHELLRLLHQRYHRDPQSRAQLVRAALRLRQPRQPHPTAERG